MYSPSTSADLEEELDLVEASVAKQPLEENDMVTVEYKMAIIGHA